MVTQPDEPGPGIPSSRGNQFGIENEATVIESSYNQKPGQDSRYVMCCLLDLKVHEGFRAPIVNQDPAYCLMFDRSTHDPKLINTATVLHAPATWSLRCIRLADLHGRWPVNPAWPSVNGRPSDD